MSYKKKRFHQRKTYAEFGGSSTTPDLSTNHLYIEIYADNIYTKEK